MKNWFFCTLLLLSNSLAAHDTSILTNEFIEYHLRAAVDGVEDEYVFKLIQENINNLKNYSISDSAANELINLIEEGYIIDSFNIALLIDNLININSSNNATKVMIRAIECESPITPEHMSSLIKLLINLNSSDNAADVIIKAIEHGVPFGIKQRHLLAETSKNFNARKNIERIREALHQRAINHREP